MEDKIIVSQTSMPRSENKKIFAEVVGMIQSTRQNVIRVANTALIDLYWRVGEYLSLKIASAEWGDGVVRQLADYISRNFPDIKGFSDKNLWRMKQFYETYAEDAEKLSPLVRQISWTNNCIILARTKAIKEKEFYLNLCIQERLSKRQLDRQIDSALYERTLVSQPKLSPLLREIAPEAERVFRDQYVMEFITGKEAKPENNLRKARAAKAVNQEMLALYYGIGRFISANTRNRNWGKGVLAQISERLRSELPGLRGFGESHLKNMRLFYEAWSMLEHKSSVATDETREIAGNEVDTIRQLQLANLPDFPLVEFLNFVAENIETQKVSSTDKFNSEQNGYRKFRIQAMD